MTTAYSSNLRHPSAIVVEAPVGDSIMDRLRTETADLHRLAESSGWQRAMVQGAITPALLGKWLAQLLPIHRALEDHLLVHRAASADFSVFKDDHQRESDLIADIARLDAETAMPEPLPAARAFVAELSRMAHGEHPESLLGVLYVLEGSTNGNKFIARGLMRAWRWTDDRCPRYLNPYGESQPQRWQQFKDDMNAREWTMVKRLAIIDGAKAAFSAIHALSVEMLRLHPINRDAGAPSNIEDRHRGH